jgi:hypothetical protein
MSMCGWVYVFACVVWCGVMRCGVVMQGDVEGATRREEEKREKGRPMGHGTCFCDGLMSSSRRLSDSWNLEVPFIWFEHGPRGSGCRKGGLGGIRNPQDPQWFPEPRDETNGILISAQHFGNGNFQSCGGAYRGRFASCKLRREESRGDEKGGGQGSSPLRRSIS